MAVPGWLSSTAANGLQWAGNISQAMGDKTADRYFDASSKVRDPNQVMQGSIMDALDPSKQAFGRVQGAATSRPSNGGAAGGGDGAGSGQFTQGAGGTGANTAADLAMLDSQERQLREFLGRAQGQFNNGVSSIEDGYQRNVGEANRQKDRAFRDYGVKTEDNQRNQTNQLEQVNQKANTLGNQVRRTIGRASGSGSSAYQLTGPSAVADEVSDDRENVQETFAGNYAALDRAKRDTEDDHRVLVDSYGDQKNKSLQSFREGWEGQMADANGKLGDIAANRQALRGGGVGAIMGARQPFDAEVSRRNSVIDSLYQQYSNPYQKRDVQAAAPSLRDYMTGQTAVSAGQVRGADPSNPLLKRPEDDEEDLY